MHLFLFSSNHLLQIYNQHRMKKDKKKPTRFMMCSYVCHLKVTLAWRRSAELQIYLYIHINIFDTISFSSWSCSCSYHFNTGIYFLVQIYTLHLSHPRILLHIVYTKILLVICVLLFIYHYFLYISYSILVCVCVTDSANKIIKHSRNESKCSDYSSTTSTFVANATIYSSWN